MTDILDLIDLDQAVKYFSTRVNVPSRFVQGFEETIGKNEVRTYNYQSYIELIALVAVYSAVVPIFAMLVNFKEPESKEYAIPIAMAHILGHELFDETAAGKKFTGTINIIYKSLLRDLLIVETEMAAEDYLIQLTVMALSKVIRYDYKTDTNEMNITTKFQKTVKDKTPSFIDKKRPNKDSRDKSSTFELSKIVYSITRNVIEEYMFITEDLDRFINQYGVPSPETKRLVDIAMKAMEKEIVLSDAALTLTAFTVKDYIHPAAIELLGENRPGVKDDIIGGLKHCIALAFAMIYPKNKVLACMLVSDKLVSDYLVPKTNTANIKTADINRVFPYAESANNYIAQAINIMGDELLVSTLLNRLPKDIYDGELVIVPSDIKIQILDLYEQLLADPVDPLPETQYTLI
jgi:hypothetical protein